MAYQTWALVLPRTYLALVINADIAASQYKDENGYSALLGLEGRISKNISFNTSYRKVFDNYFDLARVSQIRYLKDNQMTSEPQNYLSYSALADEILGRN